MRDGLFPLPLAAMTNPQHSAFPLSSMNAGETAEVLHLLAGKDKAGRLRELGFREGRSLSIISNDRCKLVVGLDGARFGVTCELAAMVLMQSIR